MVSRITRYVLDLVFIILAFLLCTLIALKGFSYYVSHHQQQVSSWLTDVAGQALALGAVRVDFVGLNPAFVLQDVALGNSSDQLKIKRLYIEFDLWQSLKQRRIIPKAFLISGLNIALKTTGGVQEIKSSWFDSGFGRWVLQQKKIYLHDLTLSWQDSNQRNLAIANTQAELSYDGVNHHLAAQGRVVSGNPNSSFAIVVNSPELNPNSANSLLNGYLRVHNFAVTQLVSNYHGTAELQAWFTWQGDKLQKLRALFSVHDLTNNRATLVTAQGDLTLQHQNIQAVVRNIKVVFPGYFVKPLPIDYLQTSVVFAGDRYDLRDLILQNKDLSVSGAASVRATTPKQITALLSYQLLNPANVANYYPQQILPKGLRLWLERAITGGESAEGAVSVDGVNNIHSVTSFKNFTLQYQPDWPELTNIDAQMLLSNRHFAITGNALTATDSVKIAVGIDDFKRPIVHLGVAYVGNNRGLLNFIAQSPLQKSLGTKLQQLKITGTAKLNYEADFHLTEKNREFKYRGEIIEADTRVVVPAWKIAATKLGGTIEFNNSFVRARNLTGELFDKPIAVNLATLGNLSHGTGFRIEVNGAVTKKTLATYFHTPFLKYLDGECDYEAVLHLAPDSEVLSINSNLRGLALNLPPPFAKTQQQSRYFQADISSGSSTLQYGDNLHAALRFKQQKFYSANIVLGKSLASFSSEPGVSVSGYLPHFYWNEWRSYLTKQRTNEHSLLRSINLEIGEIAAFNQHYHNTKLTVTPAAKGYKIGMDGERVVGSVMLPNNFPKQQLAVTASKLYLQLPHDTRPTLDPRTIPPLAIDIQNLHLNEQAFDRVKFTTDPVTNGVQINDLDIGNTNFSLRGAALWKRAKHGEQGGLYGTLTSADFGALLKSVANTDTLHGGKGTITFTLSWPNSLFKPNLAYAHGNFMLDIHDGSIIHLSKETEQKIGLGRVLNLFSLQSIPRRLTLNFSDLTQKGFVFKELKGYFVVHGGSAYTDNVNLEGEIAHIGIKGRLGILAKDYNLTITLIPYVTSSLPLLVAIAGGPIAGAATWVADELFRHTLQKATAYKYSVTGPWKNPQVRKLGQEQKVG